MGQIFIYALCAIVVLMTAREVNHYMADRDGDGELPYPRKRLVRRIANAALMLGLLAAFRFKPVDIAPIADLTFYGVSLCVVFLIMLLTFRDLRETSLSVVEAHNEFKRGAAAQIRENVAEVRRAQEEAARQASTARAKGRGRGKGRGKGRFRGRR